MTVAFDTPVSGVAVVTEQEEITKSAVSWAAVFAGAVVAAATTTSISSAVLPR